MAILDIDAGFLKRMIKGIIVRFLALRVMGTPYTIPDQGLSAQRMMARAIEAGIEIALDDGQGRVFDPTS
jgi:hypothetical protein